MIVRLLLVFAFGVLLSFPAAEAHEPPPQEDIYLYPHPHSGYEVEAMYVAGVWNSLRLPPRMEVVKEPRPDAIHILSAPLGKMQAICDGNCIGQASSEGWQDGKKSVILWKDMPGLFHIRSALLMHEVGHLLGLPHSSSDCALMSSGFDRKCRKAMFARDDLLALKKLYPSWEMPPK